ncbi:MAG TPA: FAD-binding oxidoreductase [Lysobacter sp.]|nr:FAD-binding oxidoreductase [Lysobacter sp.]
MSPPERNDPLQRNDVHSRLNPTRHARIERPGSPEQIADLLHRAGRSGQRVAVAGAQHAMGGQQFAEGGWLLDTAALAGVIEFDRTRGLVRCGAGTRWPALQGFLMARRTPSGEGWALRQKQTGADDFSLGGALAANIHGRGLDMRPFVEDIEAFTLVTPDGGIHRVDRGNAPETFALTVGGYGMFGVVTDLTLRLAPRRMLTRRASLIRRHELHTAFEQARADGALYGDFQFAIDPDSPDFLDLGVLSVYLPCDGAADPADAARHLSPAHWHELLALAHTDKTAAFRRYSEFYLSTDGQRYGSDDHQFGVYLDGYHDAVDGCLGHHGSELITELYVPRVSIAEFLGVLAEDCRRHRTDLIYGTVRQIRAEHETRLRWARQDWACVVLNVHVRHDADGRRGVRADMRRLIDRALALGGSFYLTYHRDARPDQLRAAYPEIDDVFATKRVRDPRGVLASDWYCALQASLLRAAA